MEVAIIIPCFNEEKTISQVVTDCRSAMPQAKIYVFDNNSLDQTKKFAEKAGALVIPSTTQGKGAVIRHAFRIIQADYLVMLDGDDTYPAQDIPKLVQIAHSGQYDMVIGTRLENHTDHAFRKKHRWGNLLFSRFVTWVFGSPVKDIFSGFRVFSQTFVHSVHLNSSGFEIEADLTLKAISQDWRFTEVPIFYKNRPQGSFSKLNTYKDGLKILKFIFSIIRDYRPLPFFAALSLLIFISGLFVGWAPVRDYIEYSYVYTVPRAILAASMIILSAVLIGVGLILDSQIRYYLSHLHLMKNFKNQQTLNEKNKKIA